MMKTVHRFRAVQRGPCPYGEPLLRLEDPGMTSTSHEYPATIQLGNCATREAFRLGLTSRSLSDIGSCSISCCHRKHHEMVRLQVIAAAMGIVRIVGQAPRHWQVRRVGP